jgi:hypothetical protein
MEVDATPQNCACPTFKGRLLQGDRSCLLVQSHQKSLNRVGDSSV